MTVFDALLLAVLGISIFFAAVRGALRELATLLALSVAALAAWLGTKPLLSIVGKQDSFFANVGAASALGLCVFVLSYFLVHKGLLRVKLNANQQRIDRIGGGVFGLARALALIGLGFLGYGYYLDEQNQPDAVRKALLLPVAASAADFFGQFAPRDADLKETPLAPKADAAKDGYANADRAGLKEIVTTVTTTEDKAPSADPIADIITQESPDDADRVPR
jgi:uncharacterized membrane protein required for colicin V production